MVFVGGVLDADHVVLSHRVDGEVEVLAAHPADRADLPLAGARSHLQVAVELGGPGSALLEATADAPGRFTAQARRTVEAFAPVLAACVELGRRSLQKDRFLAITAHELRTPLSAAEGFASTLAARGDALDVAETERLLERILHHHGRLDRLIHDLVEMSGVQGGRLRVEIEQVDIGALVARVVDDAELGARRRVVDVSADLPPVLADPARLEQVLSNLLSNAAKFSPQASTVRVAVGAGEGAVDISVHDEGPGVPEHLRERIFDAYDQGSTGETARPGGLGIGLYIARELCGAMGATLGVRGAAGSTFVVSLPVAADGA